MTPSLLSAGRTLVLSVCLVGTSLSWTTPAAAGDMNGRRTAWMEDKFLESNRSLGLSQIYGSLTMPQKIALAGKLQALVASRVPVGVENHPALGDLSPALRAMVKQIALLAHEGTPEQVEALIAAQDLDHLAPIPAPMLKLYHQAVMKERVPGSGLVRKDIHDTDVQNPGPWREQIAATSGYLIEDSGPAEVQLLSKDDDVPAAEVPHDKSEPALEGAMVVVTKIIRHSDHALVNSARLARGLNLLMRPKSAGPVTVKVAGQSATVDSPEALLDAVARLGDYEVAVFDSRMFVNFLDYSVKKFGLTFPVRIPTWAATNVEVAPGKPLIVPVCHTEHVVCLYKKGSDKPEALVRWFLAMPDVEKQGTMFRPAIYSRRAWSGYRVVRTYAGLEPARKLVAVAHRVMKAFNHLQAKFEFPGRAYGVLGVCNDTTGILEVALQGSVANSTAWPMVRDPHFDMYLGAMVSDVGLPLHDAGGLSVLDIPCDTRPDLYPSVNDKGRTLLRIGANIPTHDLSSLQFKDLGEILDTLKDHSPELAEGLNMGAH